MVTNRDRSIEQLEVEVGGDPLRELLTVRGAAQVARVSEGAVRKWVSRDQVLAARDEATGRWLVGRQSVLECEIAMRGRDFGGRPRTALPPASRHADVGSVHRSWSGR